MKNVTFFHPFLPEYRVGFFSEAKARLNLSDVNLRLVHGPCPERFIDGNLDWSDEVEVWNVGPMQWHRGAYHFRRCDLAIFPQEIKYLSGHFVHLLSLFTPSLKFAYWGHGKNFQALDPDSVAERAKRFLSLRVDWWFAYNDLSARIVRNLGYPPERITSVGNAIDTASLIRRRESLEPRELERVRAELGLRSQNVAVYTGGLYANKRLGFLLEAAQLIRKEIADFELIVIGEGPERGLVKAAAAEHPWIHEVGAKNDHEKVPYWALSKMLLMPGGVGLVILDSFALGVPMVTTDTYLHGPEIDYLKDGENGLLVACGESPGAYADAVVELFRSPERLLRLGKAAGESARHHSVEAMARNFADGVMRALETPKLRVKGRF